jgi:polysaccharide biosynthesis protein PslH
MKRLDILFLLPRYPFPVIGGDRVKPYNVLKYLGANHNVTVVTFFQGPKLTESLINAMKNLNVEVEIIKLNPIKAGIRILFRIFSKKPLEILYYEQNTYKLKVKELLKIKNFDLAFSFFMRTAEYIKDEELPKILMAEDCRTVYQRRSYESSTKILQKFVRWWEWNKLRKYEPRIVNYFDVTTLVSEQDINSMKNLNDKVEYRLLSNGTDISKFIPDENIEKENILFSGKFDVWANELMVRKIKFEILPLIKKRFPNIKLILVGANPGIGIKNLLDDDIELYANVPEVLPYLQKAKLFLHPHLGGSGIQNKLLEAMAAGCPVVTTTTGNQGINAENDKEVLIADSAEELANCAIRVLEDDNLANSISKNARELIVKKHSWESVHIQIDSIIKETCKSYE